MSAGMSILLITAALVYFGVAQRLLDRMKLTDSQALIFIGLMIAGSFVTIPIVTGQTTVGVNLGGAVVPLVIVVYLLATADTGYEKVRSVVASLVTAGIVYGISQYTDFDPPSGRDILDPLWLFSIVAGIVGYLAGRSRRASFIAGVLGILLADLIHLVRAFVTELPTRVILGGAGIFDTMVLAGLIAVGLAEVIGETRERVQGGPSQPNEDGAES
ncbi:MAG: DUF1614 domain-containing protein [Firmicutes bacterium]|jgi:uncharacterized membrane protein|nr:DUF1614 domain-containing protein [Bacillota bacterium]